MSHLRASMALLLLIPLMPAPASAAAPALAIVATGPEWSIAHVLGAPDGGVDVALRANGTLELRHVTPQGWTRAPDVIDLAPLARDAQGRLYVGVDNATWHGVAALDPAGALPVFPNVEPIGFSPQGLLTTGVCAHRTCFALVDEEHHLRIFPENQSRSASLSPWHAFAPDGSLYEALQGAILRVDVRNGTATPVAKTPSSSMGLAFAQDGSAYVVSGRNLTRLDLATGANESVLALPPLQSVQMAFADGRLWLALTPTQGPAEIGYVDLGVAGFRGFEPDFQPGPVPDLVAHVSVGPESVSGASISRLLRVSVSNEGPVAATAFATSVTWGGALSGAHQAWLNATGLAPGESVSAEFVVDTTLMAGNETATAAVPGFAWGVDAVQAESDMANNVATARFGAKVDTMREGLGT